VTDEIGAEFALADFPLTNDALAGGSFVVSIEDPYADPAEVAMLQGVGCVEVLIAGGVDREGNGWVIELFGDEISQGLVPLAAVARSLMAVALSVS
jgi:hypothetical protein